MAIILNPAIPPQVWPVNQPVTIQLGVTSASTPAVTSWAALGLPTGLSISNAGKITGTTEDPGLYNVQVWGNGSGSSGNLTFQIGISGSIGVVPGGAIEVDFDVRTGAVSIPGTEPGAEGVLVYAKRGDQPLLAVGFAKDGVLQELNLVSCDIGIKRFETEALVAESTGVWYRVGSGDGSRYVISFPLPSTALDTTLGEEEAEAGTEAAYLAEIEASWNWWAPGADPESDDPTLVIRTSQTFQLKIARDWI